MLMFSSFYLTIFAILVEFVAWAPTWEDVPGQDCV